MLAPLRHPLAVTAALIAFVLGALTFAPPAGPRTVAAPVAHRAAPSSTAAVSTTTTTAPPTTTTAQAPAPPPAPAAPVVDDAFSARVQQIIGESAAGLHVAALVARSDGVVVAARNGDVPVLPASTQKVVTAAAALDVLGGGFRYVTRAATTVAADGNGVVGGDLVLVGSGDPALAGPDFGAIRTDRPRTPLEAVADAVVASGVRRVSGRVVGDASVFPHQPAAPGWLDAYLADGDAVPSSGLTADAGRRIWHGQGGYESEPISDPAGQAAVVLTALLRERGVKVAGEPVASLGGVSAPHTVAEVASPPMSDLLRHMMQSSDNHFADAIFRTIGLNAGDATWEGSAAAVRAALTRLQIDASRLVIADGSGLSRNNRVTAGVLLAVDQALLRTGHAPLWRELPAVAAASGTLKRRLVGTPADHRMRGKTGSLRDVNALAGSVFASGGPRWRFAVIGNGLDRHGKRLVRDLQDALSVALAEEAARCEAVGCPPPS